MGTATYFPQNLTPVPLTRPSFGVLRELASVLRGIASERSKSDAEISPGRHQSRDHGKYQADHRHTEHGQKCLFPPDPRYESDRVLRSPNDPEVDTGRHGDAGEGNSDQC